MAEFTEKRVTHGGNPFRAKVSYRELERIAKDRTKLAFTDERTGLLNPRGMEAEFLRSKSIFERENDFHNYTIIALDMIGLHRLNDELGRTEADNVIISAANGLVKTTRESDLTVRYDGDEFLVVAFNCDENEARRIISAINDSLPEHVRYCIGYKEFDSDSDLVRNVTIMKNGLEEVKKTREKDENGRVVGDGVVVKLS